MESTVILKDRTGEKVTNSEIVSVAVEARRGSVKSQEEVRMGEAGMANP